jgi:outer membrane autotransporter protein
MNTQRGTLVLAVLLCCSGMGYSAAEDMIAQTANTANYSYENQDVNKTLQITLNSGVGGNYSVNVNGTGDITKGECALKGMEANSLQGTTNFDKVDFTYTGIASGVIRGLYSSQSGENNTFNINSYNYNANLKTGAFYADYWENQVAGSALYIDHGTVNIDTTNVTSLINNKEGLAIDKEASIANNGIYAGPGGVVNLNGDTFVNTIIGNTEEAYASDYGPGKSKNDAISGKYGGIVNINQSGGHKVQILGNLDCKDGTINANLDTSDSFWHGTEINPTKKDGSYRGKLNVVLSNGAQWIPDKEEAEISQITLNDNGIINLHGFNEHVKEAGLTKHLTIHDLQGNGGIFRIDVNTSAPGSDGRNGSDFVDVVSGSGAYYVQPVDQGKLADLTSPVWFADAASGVSFTGYAKKESIDEGFLYDYTPIVGENVVATDTSQYGNNWYLTGVKKDTSVTADTTIASATLNYAMATSRLEIDSLNKRLGELRDYDAPKDGLWVRTKGGSMESSNGSYFKDDYQFYQIGYDRKSNKSTDNEIWREGIAFHYTHGDSDFENGDGTNSSYGVSLYGSWAGNKGHYTDYVLKYSRLNEHFTARDSNGDSANGDFHDHALTASIEYGRKNDIGKDWIFEPQVQLMATHLTGADYTTSNHIKVHQDSLNSVIGRAGFRIGREFRQNDPAKRSKVYAKFDVLHEFSGDRVVNLLGSDATLYRQEDGSDTWFVYGVGADVALKADTFFYCDLERSFSGDINTTWQYDVGLRWQF